MAAELPVSLDKHLLGIGQLLMSIDAKLEIVVDLLGGEADEEDDA